MNQINRQVSEFGIRLLILVILLVAFALRVYRLDLQSIWWDEGHSIQMASAALAQIPILPGMDVHPPGYFFLLHEWMAVAGRSEFALRYLSVIFSVLTVALLTSFGRELGGRRVGWVAGVLAALSPLHVAYAQEVRMYAVVTFFALASVYFQWKIMEDWKADGLISRGDSFTVTKPSKRPIILHLVAYVLATVASLYTHYFTVFLLFFENLVWLVWALVLRDGGGNRRKRVEAWLGAQLAILVLFLPQLRLALRQTIAYANPNLVPPGLSEFISRSWVAYTIGTAVDPAIAPQLAWLMAGFFALALLASIVRVRQGAPNDWLGTLLFLLGWLLVPLGVYFLILQRRPSFEPRYMMLVTPALLLIMAWGLGSAIRARNQRLRWAGFGLSVALAVLGVGTWSYFTNVEASKDDSRGVAAWLAVETTPTDVVYVDVPHPFHYYADQILAPTRYLFVDIHTAADEFNAEAAGQDRRLFWVTWWGSDTDPRGVVPFLLDKAGQRAGELDFRGYHVAWWDLQGDAHFSLPTNLSQANIVFGDVIRLDGLAFSDKVQVGGAVWATLHFSLLKDVDEDYRVSVRLRDLGGEMLPPTDKDLLNDRHFRTSAWPVNDPRLNQAINVYMLPVASGASPGDYCLETVVYDADTMEALPVSGAPISECISPPGNSISAWLGTVAVSP
jgi:predicted ribosomally synthesized peptide with SipW-like signal peptide